MEVWKSFPLINGLLILHEPMRIENDFSPMEFRVRILMPNETLRRFHSPINYENNPHDQWNWRTHHFLHLGHLDGVLEFNLANFVRLTLTPYFFILIILSN
jgi:hypothetical protein